MQKLQIRLPSFKQVSMTCEYERSHLCYIMKTCKYISVVKIARLQKVAKSDFQALKVSRLREVQRWQSGLQSCKVLISTFNDIKIWVGGKQNSPLPASSRRFLLSMSETV